VRLPDFEYLEPGSLDEALNALVEHSGRTAILAGGTDLIDRLNKRLVNPETMMSLKNLSELNYIRREDDKVLIGSMTPLVSVIDSEVINEHFKALAQAVALIGAPSIQHVRGTIGGNLCLETRCMYYNQSLMWRSGRTRCHKDHGETCYAEENSDRCRSANQSDGACALMALGADIVMASTKGKRKISIEEFFTGKGETPFALEPDELVSEIQISVPKERHGSSFKKLRLRSSIDYALVSAAVQLKEKEGKITEARIAIGGAGASPLFLKEASELIKGKEVNDSDAVDKAAERVIKHTSAFMVENLGSTLEYRRKMSGLMAKTAIEEALERLKS
jgi:4-hydroxybenzoyl-CoA reductase subunit beta